MTTPFTPSLTSLEAALDRIAILIAIDPNGCITRANQNFYKLTGFTPAEILGREFRELSPDLADASLGADLWQGEISLTRPTVPTLWLETRITPVSDEAGKVKYFIAISFDISERKLREEQQKKTEREHEHFAYVAAHDLHEPLRKVRAFSERLTSKLSQILPPEGQDYLVRIHGAVARMQNLIDDLLAYSRAAHEGEAFKTVDLNQTLQDVLSDLEIQIEQLQQPNPVKFTHLPTIEGDPTELHRLLQNLLSNALKYHAPGRPAEVTVSATVDDGNCVLSVRDNGIGLQPENLERIFHAFNRLHSQREFPGTGIGLAICRRITDRHHGSITARSTPGIGSEFLVTLPLTQPAKGQS